MPIKSPWYSKKDTSVYHNNSACDVGNNIETVNIQQGTGGGHLCFRCATLNSQGK